MKDKPFLKLIRVFFAAEDGIRCRFGRTLNDDDKDSFELAVPRTYETAFKHKRVTDLVANEWGCEPTLPYFIGWAVLMSKRDLIGITRHWTDLVFTLHIYTRMKLRKDRKYPSVLVLSPTPDSAGSFDNYLKEYPAKDVNSALCCGGRDQPFESIDIVVGTPDEILRLTDGGHLDLAEVDYLVLDEVDDLLGTTHQVAVNTIVTGLRARRRTVLRSDTWTESVGRLARSHMCDPVLLDDSTRYIKEVADGADSDSEAAEMPGGAPENPGLLDDVEAPDYDELLPRVS